MAEHYNVAIIGGGIHGTGVAQAAACAGYSVLLVEKTRLAAGSSSRSSAQGAKAQRLAPSGRHRPDVVPDAAKPG